MLYNTSIFYELILMFYFIYGQLHLSQGRNSYFMDWEVFCLYCDTFLQNISTEFPFHRKFQTVFLLMESNLQSDNIFHDMEIPSFNSFLFQSKELCGWLLPSHSQLQCQSCHFLHYVLLLFSSGFMSPRLAGMILHTGLGRRFHERSMPFF